MRLDQLVKATSARRSIGKLHPARIRLPKSTDSFLEFCTCVGHRKLIRIAEGWQKPDPGSQAGSHGWGGTADSAFTKLQTPYMLNALKHHHELAAALFEALHFST